MALTRVFGRVMPRDLLEGIGRYLKRAAPEHENELLAQIRSRAEELSEADQDTAVDRPAKGLLTMASVVLAAFEVLRPMFDGDDACRFRVMRTDDPLADHADALDQQLAD